MVALGLVERTQPGVADYVTEIACARRRLLITTKFIYKCRVPLPAMCGRGRRNCDSITEVFNGTSKDRLRPPHDSEAPTNNGTIIVSQ